MMSGFCVGHKLQKVFPSSQTGGREGGILGETYAESWIGEKGGGRNKESRPRCGLTHTLTRYVRGENFLQKVELRALGEVGIIEHKSCSNRYAFEYLCRVFDLLFLSSFQYDCVCVCVKMFS